MNNYNLHPPHPLEYTTTIDGATLPSHAMDGDVGIDLTALTFIKKIGENGFMYDTGICIKPPRGFYTVLVARSSIVKTGYIVTNSVGILDPGYRGSIRIVLTRVDSSLPELALPFKCCQLILMPVIPIQPMNVESLDATQRGDGGFGSSDKLD